MTWGSSGFPAAAEAALADGQLRKNLGHATRTIRAKRGAVVDEAPDWEALRDAGAALKDRVLRHLPEHLEAFEVAVVAAGGVVHWARDGDEASAIVAGLARDHGAQEVVKVKSLTTDEIGLNEALAAAGIVPVETDLAELIVQLAGDRQSHILVPAIHRNRREVRDLFRRVFDRPDLSDDPAELAEAARLHLRERFLRADFAVSGANFGVVETGTVCVVESEGNGRMCTTLPRVLVSVLGIEKLVPAWRDLEVFLQLLPRSSTGERMNPYTSLWTGVTECDGPREFHLVLLDAGRSATLADPLGRTALRCIRCSACLNACPVYTRTGGHAYESIYPGPIGAVLTPQLTSLEEGRTLPWASTLCGACADVCPVRIPIPELLVDLRGRVTRSRRASQRRRERADPEDAAMRGLGAAFATRRRYERAQRLARLAARPLARGGVVRRAPGPLAAWTDTRDLPAPAAQTFREWWHEEGRA